MADRIDAHHHFWRYSPEEYTWMNERMGMLRRDFLPEDLASELERAPVDGVVTVQARQSIKETSWLLELAEKESWIRGVVGWGPIADADFGRYLETLHPAGKLKGLRHVVQDEPDDRFLLREDFNRGIAALLGTGLVYDILIFERHLPYAIEFVDRHPSQVFVLDHAAKPRIHAKEIEPWRTRMRELAARHNVYCKLSGLATEANWIEWTREDLQPYCDVLLETFGPERILVGSDWPVCLLASSYARWFQAVDELIGGLSDAEQEKIRGGTAIKVYQLASSAAKAD